MKLKEWIAYNRPLYSNDLVVKVCKEKSYSADKVAFKTVANLDICLQYFGELEVAKVGVVERPSGNGTTLGVLLWPTE